MTSSRKNAQDHPDRDLLKILRDPVRRRLLFVIGEKPDGVSIRQIAKRLGEPQRRVRHFIGALVDAGLVVIEQERPRRGTIERTFRLARFPLLWADGFPGRMESSEKKVVILDTLRLVFDTVVAAVAAGTFTNRSGWCVARTWREVDREGWEELAEIHERAVGEVIAAVERSEERLARSDEARIPAISALLLLEALPWED